jgi:hypothetical protein
MQLKGRARNRVEQILQGCKGDKFNEWEQGRIQTPCLLLAKGMLTLLLYFDNKPQST